MPITKKGYELHIVRTGTQKRDAGKFRIRTVGTYQVFHDGVPVAGLSGAIFEQRGPGNNKKKGNDQDLCIEEGRYPLATQDGTKYKTIKYKKTPEAKTTFAIRPRPGIELLKTGQRSEILIHPAEGFLSSLGCIHPSKPLSKGTDSINFAESRRRVIAIIDDMASFLASKFPAVDGKPIPDAFVVIDDNSGQ